MKSYQIRGNAFGKTRSRNMYIPQLLLECLYSLLCFEGKLVTGQRIVRNVCIAQCFLGSVSIRHNCEHDAFLSLHFFDYRHHGSYVADGVQEYKHPPMFRGRERTCCRRNMSPEPVSQLECSPECPVFQHKSFWMLHRIEDVDSKRVSKQF